MSTAKDFDEHFILLSADLHLDDNKDHQYRWRCFLQFDWFLSKTECKGLIIAGDVVDAKNSHKADFVNRIANQFALLSMHNKPVIVIRGNHDCVDRATPFFHFLRFFKNIDFVTDVKDILINRWLIRCIPNGEKWPAPKNERLDLIVCHETFTGAVSETGRVLDGQPKGRASKRKWFCPVLSGDIHTPQKLGNVEYIGSPHPVRFGDDYKTRMLAWFGRRNIREIEINTIKRMHMHGRLEADGKITGLKITKQVRDEDHVKVTLSGPVEAMQHWAKAKNAIVKRIEAMGAKCFGCDFIPDTTAVPEQKAKQDDCDLFDAYCKAKRVPKPYVRIGKKIYDRTRDHD